MRFVIIASPRTGSTHLTSLLNEHADIACHGELFHPKKAFVRWPRGEKTPDAMAKLMSMRQRSAEEFLDHVCAKSGCANVGFKIFAGHNDAFLETVIASETVRKIVLYRPNLLASYSSSLIARDTGRGGARVRPPKPPKVRFDAARFTAYAERHCAFYRSVFERLNAAGQVFFVIQYEQINDPWLFANLVNFVGAKPDTSIARSRREKLNTSDILSRFSNSDDVAEFVRNHDLHGWLHEAPVSFDPFGFHKPGVGD